MRKLDLLAATLLIVGGLNWGLVAIAKFDLVAWIVGLEFGETNAVSRIVYGLVGLAAVYGIVRWSAVSVRTQPRASRRSLTPKDERTETREEAHSNRHRRRPRLAVAGAPATARNERTKNIVQTAQAAGTFKTLTKLVTKPVSPERSRSPVRTPSSPRPTRRSGRCRSRP